MKKGFTLIELIITTLFLSILVGVMGVVFLTGLKAWNSGFNRAGARQDASLAMNTMIGSLIQARNITVANVDTITFSADINNDARDEIVVFSRDANNNLTQTIDGAQKILAPNSQSLTFSYIDVNNNSIVPRRQADRDNIRVVNIILMMNKAGEACTLTSGAYIRNQGL